MRDVSSIEVLDGVMHFLEFGVMLMQEFFHLVGVCGGGRRWPPVIVVTESLSPVRFHGGHAVLHVRVNLDVVALHPRGSFAPPDCVDDTIDLDCVVIHSMPGGIDQLSAMMFCIVFGFFQEASISGLEGNLGSASHLAGLLSFEAVEADIGFFDCCRDKLPWLVGVLVEN